MTLDLTKTPFSQCGSYISLGSESAGTLILRSVRRRFGQERFLTVSFHSHGKQLEPAIHAKPGLITVDADDGKARIALCGDNGLTIESDGLEIQLSLVGGGGFGLRAGPSRFQFVSLWNALWGAVSVHCGAGAGNFGWELKNNTYQGAATVSIAPADGRSLTSLIITPVEARWPDTAPDIEECIASAQRNWRAFLAQMPPVPDAYRSSGQLAWYNLWSCFVRAEGNFTHDAILMSKMSMAALWPWDHCFNALAMAKADLKVAIEQYLLPFELQQPSGMLPDFVQVDSRFDMVTKAPIHGWCIARILDDQEVDRATLERIYQTLAKWTQWWFDFRDHDGDGIPHYMHGWDGWDNSTMFDNGPCLEAPDLTAYLVLQMHSLADIAHRIGDLPSCSSWRERATSLLQKLYAHSWTGGTFVAKRDGSHIYDSEPTSLLSVMPIVLGEHLDPSVFEAITACLVDNYLTPFGPATEMPTSPDYLADGYWRGPIWAPVTYLIVDGLRRGGRLDLATDIARRFCDLVHKSGGNYENYDSLTGRGLREQGYTWTAAVHLLLLNEYLLADGSANSDAAGAAAGAIG